MASDLFWDRELSDGEVRRFLAEGAPEARLWAIRRILEYGTWDEVRRYLSLTDIEQALPHLSFRDPHLLQFWRDAVAQWRMRRP